MTQRSKAGTLVTYNDATTGLFKNNSSKAIGADDVRALVTDLTDSVPFTSDDQYSWTKGRRVGATAPASIKDIVTTSLSFGTLIDFIDSTASNVVRVYELVNETTAESSPTVIRPNDYAGTTNEKVWRLRATVSTGSIDDHFQGVYTDETALTTAHPTADEGDYAFVDTGAASPVELWIWDESDTEWVQSGATGGTVLSVSGTTNRITSTGGATPVIDISATFEALLSKVAQRIDQNNAATTSAQLAGVISDETGSGALVFATSPTLVTPALGTPSAIVLTNATGLPGTAAINTPAGNISATNVQAAINELDTEKLSVLNSSAALTDGATVDITSRKNTLTSSSATRTFTISYTGDELTLRVILNTTTATWTFPAGALCVAEGAASGNNIIAVAGTSGDHYVIAIENFGSGEYSVVCKNFGQ